MSENKKYFYLKVKDNFFASEEMLMLESVPNGLVYQNIYLRMCLLSLKNEGALTFKNMIPYDLKMLSTVLRIDIATMKLAVELFEQLGLVTKTDNEVLFMSDIQTLIGQSSTEAERVASYRKRINNNKTQEIENKKEECTKSVQMLQNCTPEIELEKEIKLELEKEPEIEPNGEDCGSVKITFSSEVEPEPVGNIDNSNTSVDTPKTTLDLQETGKLMLKLIKQHNESVGNAQKLAVSTSEVSFMMKEMRDISHLVINEGANPNTLVEALKNYLLTAKDKSTWKTNWSWADFTRHYLEFCPEFFSKDKYKNKPKGFAPAVAQNSSLEGMEILF